MAISQQKPALLWLFPLAALALTCAIIFFNGLNLADQSLARSHAAYTLANSYRTLPGRNPRLPKVVIADIDQKSRKALGRWPWPRTRYAEIITRLKDAGAEIILLDEIFDEPDPTSPDQMLETWWNTPGLEDALEPLSRLPDHDAIFARALRSTKTVTAFQFTNNKTGPTASPKMRMTGEDTTAPAKLPSYTGMRSTLRPLVNSSTGYGALTITKGPNGKVQTLPLTGQLGQDIYPNQILEALRLWQNAPDVKMTVAPQYRGTALAAFNIGPLSIPVTAKGDFLLTTSPQNKPITYSVIDVLQNKVGANELKGNFVILSASADMATPLFDTPLDQNRLGAQIRGQALSQIINGDFLTRPFWAIWSETAAAASLGLLFIALAYFTSLYWAGIILVLECVLIAGLSWYAYAAHAMLFDMGTPISALLLVFAPTAFTVKVQAKAQQNYIRSVFGNYLLPSTVTSLTQDTSNRNYVGEKREATVLIGNIRGIRKLEEHYGNQPEDLTLIVNEFLSEMTKHVHDTNGTVNRYIGDRIMAVWNAPLQEKNHAQNAADCALKMVESLDRLNTRLEEKARGSSAAFKQVELGIGIDTGECVTGIMGSRLRDEYSVIGQAFRSARRLNASSETYGPAIIVGENTYIKIHHDYALLEVDYVEMPNRPHPTRVFALMGNPVMKANPRYRTLEKAHQAYFTAFQACDWEAALTVTQDARLMSGSIPTLYDLYDRRVYFYMQNPPSEDWIGAHNQPVI